MTDDARVPLAVLLGFDHSERVIRLMSDPPPRVIELPVLKPLALREDEAPSRYLPPHRVFRLSAFRSPAHRWMRVYNEGRSQTPEDGYVYLEKR